MPPIETLVPHKPPMRLVDELRRYDDQSTTCVARLNENAPFMSQGRVPGIVALEYMAQCVAAYATLHPTEDAKNSSAEPRIGYLVGVRGLELMVDCFHVGDELEITVKHVWGSDQGAQFQGQITRQGMTVASATLTVFVPPFVAEGDA